MNVGNNLAQWHEIKAALTSDPDPRSQDMMEFIEVWADTAEVLIEKIIDVSDSESGPDGYLLPMEALRRTLEESQLKSGHLIPIMSLGQALLILGSVWEPAARDRDCFVTSMSSIERKLFSELAMVWQAHRQQAAQQQETVR